MDTLSKIARNKIGNKILITFQNANPNRSEIMLWLSLSANSL